MTCAEVRVLLSPYLDSTIVDRDMHSVSSHLQNCARCRVELQSLAMTQQAISGLGYKPVPADLSLKLRLMASRHIAKQNRKPLEGLLVRWQNAINAFMVPATAGMVSAVVMFGLLIGFLVPGQLQARNDVPLNLFTPPQLTSSPFGFEMKTASDSIVIEAYVDAHGRVQDYRILSAPEEARPIMSNLKNMLLFTQFRPATAFGKPTSGRAILTFSGITVKG